MNDQQTKKKKKQKGRNTERRGELMFDDYFLFTVDFNDGNSSVEAKFGSFFLLGR